MIPHGLSECGHCGRETGHTPKCPIRPGRLTVREYIGYGLFMLSVAVAGGALGWAGAVLAR